ncbi:hypothetical protein LZ30DRAFT_719716 [Colletotrichum cereale]|nr:hypothetical protein LZ30DRAFT_719716 [Colletotrichum cereale]
MFPFHPPAVLGGFPAFAFFLSFFLSSPPLFLYQAAFVHFPRRHQRFHLWFVAAAYCLLGFRTTRFEANLIPRTVLFCSASKTSELTIRLQSPYAHDPWRNTVFFSQVWSSTLSPAVMNNGLMTSPPTTAQLKPR